MKWSGRFGGLNGTGMCLTYSSTRLPGLYLQAAPCVEGDPSQQWNTPCDLPGSFSHPKCDAYYTFSSPTNTYFKGNTTIYVSCTGTAVSPGYGDRCLSCLEPWQLLPAAYAHAQQPMVLFSNGSGTSSALVGGSAAATLFSADALWPGQNYGPPSGPSCTPAAIRTSYDKTTKTELFTTNNPFPSCGPMAAEFGQGVWWQLPPPTASFTRCPDGVSQVSSTGTCPVPYYEGQGAHPGFVCPKASCNVFNIKPVKFKNGQGLNVSIANDISTVAWAQQLPSDEYQKLVRHQAFSDVNFGTNAAWYPLFQDFGRLLSYDVSLLFEGYIVPDATCAFSLTLYSDDPTTSLKLFSPEDETLLDEAVGGTPGVLSVNHRTYGPFSMVKDGLYFVEIVYNMPASLGIDAVTGDSEVPYRDRELRLMWSCASVASRYLVVPIPATSLRNAPAPAVVRALYVPAPLAALPYVVSTFGRVGNAMAAVMPTWTPRVTEPLLLAAEWMQPMLAPAYAGAAQPAVFATKYAATVLDALFSKLVYAMMAVGMKGTDQKLVATQQCLSELGRTPRAYMDALLDSLPNTVEFFLDIKAGRFSEGEQSACAASQHENLILAGSLKMYSYATAACNVRYTDGSLVRCTMEDGVRGSEHCAGFQLPDARFNTNFLCAADALGIKAARKMLWAQRLGVSWAEGLVASILRCINGGSCGVADFVNVASSAVEAELSENLCNTYELTVQAANVLSATLSPAFQAAYAASGHPVVQGGLSQSGTAQYLLHAHADASLCQGLAQSSCRSPNCTWITETSQPDFCAMADAPWLLHQSYPIEAALTTLLTSFANYVFFWPQFMAKRLVDTIVNVLKLQSAEALDPGSVQGGSGSQTMSKEPISFISSVKVPQMSPPPGGGLPTFAGSDNSRYGPSDMTPGISNAAKPILNQTIGDWGEILKKANASAGTPRQNTASGSSVRQAVLAVPRALLINYIQDFVIPLRDIMMAFYEFVRACVYVAEPTDLYSSGFRDFTLALRTTVDVIELFASIATEALVDLVQVLVRILSDVVRILQSSGLGQVERYAIDIVKALVWLFKDLEQLILRLLMSIPGLDQLCPVIFVPLSDVIVPVQHMVCTITQGLVMVLNPIESVLKDIANAIDDIIPLHLDSVTHAIQTLTTNIAKATCTPIDLASLCNKFKSGNGTEDFEPSPCVKDKDCSGGSALCWVDADTTTCRWSNFIPYPKLQPQHSEWDQPCKCNDFAPGSAAPFCNVATGFCQVCYY